MFTSPEDIQEQFARRKFIIGLKHATVVFLALRLHRPLLVEGPAGVGKTELARVLAETTGSRFIRLQCYEGLDECKALYEWNYHKQLLRIYADHQENKTWEHIRQSIYTPEFLLDRPLLKALSQKDPVVLLIDELDKSDEEFESFLLEILSEYQISIPELGTVRAEQIPAVVLTSNNFRNFGDALKRRCIHLYIDYPDFDQELQIVRLKVPGIDERFAHRIVSFIQNLRKDRLRKAPSIAETINWAEALLELGIDEITEKVIDQTAGVFLKYREDIEKISSRELPELLD